MRFYEVGKEGAPRIAFVGPALCGWWAMAPLSSLFKDEYRCILMDHDVAPFTSIADEGRELADRVAETGGTLAAVVGCGMGAQVVVEALCEDSRLAQCAVIGDCLCVDTTGVGLNAGLTALFWPFVKRKRYGASYARGLGLTRSMVDPMREYAATVSKADVKRTLVASFEWRVPSDVSAIRVPVTIAQDGLQSAPFTKSAEILDRSISNSKLVVARDQEQYELYIRHPMRGAELVEQALASVRSSRG